MIYSDQSADRSLPHGTLDWGISVSPYCYPAGDPKVAACIAAFAGVTNAAQLVVRTGCGKSISFGTQTYVTINGTTSGDIQCADQTSVAYAINASCEQLLGYW